MSHKTQSPLNNAELDRLIDGELSIAEQRNLLSRLEAEEDGWRRLALGFLEAQALRQICPGLLTDGPRVASRTSTGLTRRKDPGKAFPGLPWGLVTIAAAASFLLGLSINRWQVQPPESAITTASSKATTSAPSRRTPVDKLQVIFPEGPGRWSEPVELPVVDRNDVRAQFWLSDQPVWPQAVRSSLRESGQEVAEQRHWMQVELEDGRQGYVPVSELIVSANDPSRYP